MVGYPLIVLYFWPFPYFKDVMKGSRREQELAYQHNVSKAHYLPIYLRRWLFVMGLLFALMGWFDAGTSLPMKLLAGSFGTLFACATAFEVLLAGVYMMLMRDVLTH